MGTKQSSTSDSDATQDTKTFIQSFPTAFHEQYGLSLGDPDNTPQVIGKGGFSTIFLAHGTGNNAHTQYAVKYINIAILEQKITQGELVRAKVENNIRNTRRGLQVLHNFSGHPSIIHLHSMYDAKASLITVMEHANGGDLYDRITSTTQPKLNVQQIQQIIKQIASGISFLHEMGSCHRDVKCENICLVEDNSHGARWKLCDFGFSRDLEEDDRCTTICGTKGYAAPEIFLGKPYNGKEVDIYALGVVTHMTVGGYLPFKDGGVKVVFHPERWAQVSQVCKDFVKALLLFDPKDRLQSTDVMQHVWLSSK